MTCSPPTPSIFPRVSDHEPREPPPQPDTAQPDQTQPAQGGGGRRVIGAGLAGSGCSNLIAGLRPGSGSAGTVQHMAWSSNEDERELYVALFDAFEEEYPDQRVEYIHAPNDYTT